MKRFLPGFIIGLLAGAILVWFLPAREKKDEEEKKAEAKESRLIETNGERMIHLDRVSQERMGLRVEELKAVTIRPEARAYGRVLDPAPLGALAIELATARSALEASQREFERLKTLHEQQQNVSTRALELAEAASKRDRVALDSAKLRLLLDWGREVASRTNLAEFVQSLASLESCIVRLDVPPGKTQELNPVGARIAPLGEENRAAAADFLGPVTRVDPQSQGRGFLFMMRQNALAPGAAVVGWLALSGDPMQGVEIPANAVVRHEAGAFIYSSPHEDLFSRKEIALEHPLTNGWFAGDGWKAGQKIVTRGAQQLLSEEFKAQTEEE